MRAEVKESFLISQASSVQCLLKLVKLANWQSLMFLDKMTVTA